MINTMSTNHTFFLLTGEPGVGKTTLIKKLTSLLNEKGIKTSGFYTEEVRNNRIREGFDVISLDGQRGILARDQCLLKAPVKYNVGKYGVLIQEFEKIALPTLSLNIQDNKTNILVIDEIGKMEFFSNAFKTKIKELFGQGSQNVLATIPLRKGDAIIETIRNHRKAKVWIVTRENRNSLCDLILNDIASQLIKDV